MFDNTVRRFIHLYYNFLSKLLRCLNISKLKARIFGLESLCWVCMLLILIICLVWLMHVWMVHEWLVITMCDPWIFQSCWLPVIEVYLLICCQLSAALNLWVLMNCVFKHEYCLLVVAFIWVKMTTWVVNKNGINEHIFDIFIFLLFPFLLSILILTCWG